MHKAAIYSRASKPGAVDILMDYHWPGNVRELQNIIERSLILNPKGPLTFDHLFQGPNQKSPAPAGKRTDNLDQVISQHIKNVLAKAEGKVNGDKGAAALLGVNPSTLRNRMKKLGIDYQRKG